MEQTVQRVFLLNLDPSQMGRHVEEIRRILDLSPDVRLGFLKITDDRRLDTVRDVYDLATRHNVMHRDVLFGRGYVRPSIAMLYEEQRRSMGNRGLFPRLIA